MQKVMREKGKKSGPVKTSEFGCAPVLVYYCLHICVCLRTYLNLFAAVAVIHQWLNHLII